MGEVHVVYFDNGFKLESVYEYGKEYELASIKFKLINSNDLVVLETPFVPIRCLFDFVFMVNKQLQVNKIKAEFEFEDLKHIYKLMQKRKDRREGKMNILDKKEKKRGKKD